MSNPNESVFDQEQILSKVRKLTVKAEHPETPPAEAETCRALAHKLMLDWAITSAMVREQSEVKKVPGTIEVGTGGNEDISGWVNTLVAELARHCRVKIKQYKRWDRESRSWMATVYGWESDLAYFEVLYTELRLHMLGVLRPGWDSSRSDEENSYRLHNAGYNWTEIAELRGWRKTARLDGEPKVMYRHKDTGERLSIAKACGRYLLAYKREVKAMGEEPTKLAPGGTNTYRDSAAQGYVSRQCQRMRQAAEKAEAEAEATSTLKFAPVLKKADEELEDYVREQNKQDYARCPFCDKLSGNRYKCDRCGEEIAKRPEEAKCPRCEAAKSGRCREHRPSYSYRYVSSAVSNSGYAAGVRHANTFDYGKTGKVRNQGNKEID